MNPTGSNDTDRDLASQQQLNAKAKKESGSLQKGRGSHQKGHGSHQKGSGSLQKGHGSLQKGRGSCSNRYGSLSEETETDTDVEPVDEDTGIGAASAALSADIEAAKAHGTEAASVAQDDAAAETHGTEASSVAQDEGFASPRGRGRPRKNPGDMTRKNFDETFSRPTEKCPFDQAFHSNAKEMIGNMLSTGPGYNSFLCQTCLTIIRTQQQQQKNPSFCSVECFLEAEECAIGAVVCAVTEVAEEDNAKKPKPVVILGREMRGHINGHEIPGGGRKKNPNPKKGEPLFSESTKQNAAREFCEEIGLTGVLDFSSVPMFPRVLWYRKGKGKDLVCYFVYVLRMVGFDLKLANNAIKSRSQKSDLEIPADMKELNQIIAVPLENLKAHFTSRQQVTDTSGQLVTRISTRWRNFFMNEASLEMLIALSADQSVNALEIHPGESSYLFEASQLPLKYKV
uniref:Nudix hydrolase domain-containing protein n=1 Tax=viral metagenome TaxID=1070528 RepID=A0A6C0E810_9ZZZZ